MSLAEDINEAKIKYKEKRNHFIALSISFHDRVQKWQDMPHISVKKGKEAVSVYKHKSTKGGFFIRAGSRTELAISCTVPSQLAIYQKMMSDERAFASTMIPNSKVAWFLDEGLKIQEVQYVPASPSTSFNNVDWSGVKSGS